VHEIMRGMRARRGGFRVSADTAPLVVHAPECYHSYLGRIGREKPIYRVVEQFARGPELREVATALDLEIAIGAVGAAARQWPTSEPDRAARPANRFEDVGAGMRRAFGWAGTVARLALIAVVASGFCFA
jgi:hypothetical protein